MTNLANVPTKKKVAAIAGFLFLGLSPTYLEWQEQPEKRPQIVAYYAIAASLFYYGLFTN